MYDTKKNYDQKIYEIKQCNMTDIEQQYLPSFYKHQVYTKPCFSRLLYSMLLYSQLNDLMCTRESKLLQVGSGLLLKFVDSCPTLTKEEKLNDVLSLWPNLHHTAFERTVIQRMCDVCVCLRETSCSQLGYNGQVLEGRP